MTSQINSRMTTPKRTRNCRPPENAPADYCEKLKNGIGRLQAALETQYEEAFPAGRDRISQALQEAKESAWNTPFPSLFFPALAHLRVNQLKP